MKRYRFILALLLASLSIPANAAPILDWWGININGAVYETFAGDVLPGEVDVNGFDDFTGLGTVSNHFNSPGAYNISIFFDHEVDETTNTFFNETGTVTGTPVVGQSWEIDEPGFNSGDIYDNFRSNQLDNQIGVSIYGNTAFPDDVSVALGWEFQLLVGQSADLDFLVSLIQPASGFYLTQTDSDSNQSIYFNSSLRISETTAAPVPEPHLNGLIAIALLTFLSIRFYANKDRRMC
ncbi:MAG: hypothetical protein ACU84J_07815 [Gammaproteobacteria bacterium]